MKKGEDGVIGVRDPSASAIQGLPFPKEWGSPNNDCIRLNSVAFAVVHEERDKPVKVEFALMVRADQEFSARIGFKEALIAIDDRMAKSGGAVEHVTAPSFRWWNGGGSRQSKRPSRSGHKQPDCQA